MSAIAQCAAAPVKPSRSPLPSLIRRLLSLRTRIDRIDVETLPDHLQRDLGLLDGRDLPPRAFR